MIQKSSRVRAARDFLPFIKWDSTADEQQQAGFLAAMQAPLPDPDRSELLYLPGRILTIVYNGTPEVHVVEASSIRSRHDLQHAHMIESRPEDYERTIISSTMLTDHLPWRYERALLASSGRRGSMGRFGWL